VATSRRIAKLTTADRSRTTLAAIPGATSPSARGPVSARLRQRAHLGGYILAHQRIQLQAIKLIAGDDGLIVGRSGGQRYSDTMTLSPPVVITRGEIDRILETLNRTIAVMPAVMDADRRPLWWRRLNHTVAGCLVSAGDLAYSLPSCSSMRPARLCRAMAAPTWFGRTPLHAVAISCCVLPVAKDLVIETRGTALAASWFCGGRALAPA
jgi:hypothetical protein